MGNQDLVVHPSQLCITDCQVCKQQMGKSTQPLISRGFGSPAARKWGTSRYSVYRDQSTEIGQSLPWLLWLRLIRTAEIGQLPVACTTVPRTNRVFCLQRLGNLCGPRGSCGLYLYYSVCRDWATACGFD